MTSARVNRNGLSLGLTYSCQKHPASPCWRGSMYFRSLTTTVLGNGVVPFAQKGPYPGSVAFANGLGPTNCRLVAREVEPDDGACLIVGLLGQGHRATLLIGETELSELPLPPTTSLTFIDPWNLGSKEESASRQSFRRLSKRRRPVVAWYPLNGGNVRREVMDLAAGTGALRFEAVWSTSTHTRQLAGAGLLVANVNNRILQQLQQLLAAAKSCGLSLSCADMNRTLRGKGGQLSCEAPVDIAKPITHPIAEESNGSLLLHQVLEVRVGVLIVCPLAERHHHPSENERPFARSAPLEGLA